MALLIVPAATVRLWTRWLGPWHVGSITLVAVEGIIGLWLSVQTNAPPGATIAMLGGGVFAPSLALRRLTDTSVSE
jgi:ABC-type Mn2+/Zn2+ transport system permease subunit